MSLEVGASSTIYKILDSETFTRWLVEQVEWWGLVVVVGTHIVVEWLVPRDGGVHYFSDGKKSNIWTMREVCKKKGS